MKGHVKIELLEIDGTPVSTQEADNLVLPTITDFLQDMANFYNTPVAAGLTQGLTQPQQQIQDVVTKFNGVTKLLEATTFGLVLYNEVKPTDKKGYAIGKEPLARAGKTRTATAVQGTFVSTTAIKNAANAVIGNRMIWDFPAICANGTIASLALTTREFCDNTLSKKHTAYATSMAAIPYLNSNYQPPYPVYDGIGCNPTITGEFRPGKRFVSIQDNAEFVYAEGNIVKRDRASLILNALPGPIYENDSAVLCMATGFTSILKVVDSADVNEYIIFGVGPNGNNAVAYINKDTQIIRLMQEIACTNALAIDDWGLCGKFILLVSHTNELATSQPVLYCANPETNTYTTITIPNKLSGDYTYRWMRTLLTYRTIEGDYACDFVYDSWYSGGSYSAKRYLELFIAPDGNSVVTNTLNALVDNASVDNAKVAPYLNFGVRPTALLNSSGYSYELNYNYIELGFARRALFSICNLATPIVKTSTQVLRVSYDLTWA